MSVIAVLALQGAFAEHEKMLDQLGAEHFEIRRLADIDRSFDGLIIPGGESTVQGKLLRDLGLFEPLNKLISGGLPTFGTCAGMILLAEKLENDSEHYFSAMPMTVKRNAYGRQLGSFYTESEFAGSVIPMTFIRAPYIADIGGCEKLAEVEGKATAARYKNCLAAAFHPELNEDLTVHKYFLDMVAGKV